MLNGATMGAVCCANQLFTIYFPTRNWTELTKFPCHKRHHSAVALLGRKTNLLSHLREGHCLCGKCHQEVIKVNEMSSPFCSNLMGIKAMSLITLSTRTSECWFRATKTESLNSGCRMKATNNSSNFRFVFPCEY